MYVHLVFEDHWTIPVPMDDRLREALGVQLEIPAHETPAFRAM